jgi:tripartite-type tricarboxylate transporter receptor subunit TctC
MPALQLSLWMGIAGPVGTPGNIVSRMNREMSEVLALPKVVAVLSEQGFETEPGSPEAMSERISNDVIKLREVAEKTGLRPH